MLFKKITKEEKEEDENLFVKITKGKDENLFVNLEHIKEVLKKDGDSDQLFILIHGWKHGAEDLKSVGSTILKDSQFQKATVVIPELNTQDFFSLSNIYTIVRNIVFLIDNLNKIKTFEKIYLIGHSAGSLIARKVYLCAYGEIPNEKEPENPKAPFESIIKTEKKKNKQSTEEALKLGTQKDWVKKVDRIILLAGINMGWTASPAFRPLALFGTDVAIVIDTLLNGLTQKLFIFQTRRDSIFITNLRFQWLIMAQEIEAKLKKEVLVIQLLGNQDNIVSPQDNIDYVTGKHFYYKDIPETNHQSIIKLNVGERGSIFKEALTYNPDSQNDKTKRFFVINDLYDQFIIDSNRDIKNVVFVIHGIRDEGFWTNRIAIKIKRQANNLGEKATWMSETSSYGYFGMLPFLFPYLRRQKVEWLMDKYIENRSLYPEANFHYIGHSNGTYLVAEALDKYCFCKFQHIVFAGSVVDSKYDWGERIRRKQIKQFLNFVATADWVVAIFPNLFEGYRWNNLGGAGHKGFNINNSLDDRQDQKFHYETNSGKEKTIHQLKYIKGDHGAAIQEDNWELIANFVINGKEALKDREGLWKIKEESFQNKQCLCVATLGFFRHLIVLIILSFIVLIASKIIVPPPLLLQWFSWLNAEWVKAVIFIAYLSVLWQFLTRI